MVDETNAEDGPLPGAVEALAEMLKEGLDVVIWLGNDAELFGDRFAWVRLLGVKRVDQTVNIMMYRHCRSPST